VRTPGTGLERSLALGAVSSQQLIDPGPRDAVVIDDLGDGPLLESDRGDDQTRL
jgi:hypothetical protein